MSLETVPALLLRSHPYSESSLILRFLTPEFGVVGVLAKGVRRRSSKGETPLETFQEGELTLLYRPERDLHGFRDFKATRSGRRLAADLLRFSGASFLAELVMAHALQGPGASLYGHFRELLRKLGDDPPGLLPARIISGAWILLDDFGFSPSLERCVRCGASLFGSGGHGADDEGAEAEGRRASAAPSMASFDFQSGGLRCPACAEEGLGPRIGPGARADLLRLVAGEVWQDLRGARAHMALVERFAIHHLGMSRAFKAGDLLRQAIPDQKPET